MALPRIAITMGDPAGVGPELCLRAMASGELMAKCALVVYGDEFVLEKASQQTGIQAKYALLDDVSTIDDLAASACLIRSGQPDAWQPGNRLAAGHVNQFTGQASFDYVDTAIRDAIAGNVDAVVTGPINKEAWNAAGINYPGHTELFAERFDSQEFCMMMTSPTLSCSLVSTHIGFSDVIDEMTTERILQVIELSHSAMQRMRGREPRLVVLGLNPHAGENGLFGNREEEAIIVPAIEAARSKGIDVTGPLPPDTAFLPGKLKQTDCHVCMYHDQGLIPFKALAFDTGVNVTLGLPVPRTSVDHGTALDIAWQGIADPSSMFAAIELAVQLSES